MYMLYQVVRPAEFDEYDTQNEAMFEIHLPCHHLRYLCWISIDGNRLRHLGKWVFLDGIASPSRVKPSEPPKFETAKKIIIKPVHKPTIL